MPSPPRTKASPARPKEPKSPAKGRKTRSKKSTGGPEENADADEEQRDSADVTIVGGDEAELAEKKVLKQREKGKAVQRAARWDWVSLLDAKTSDHPAVFSKDGRFFFLPAGASVNIHSSTGEVLSTLTPPSAATKSSKLRATSLALNPANAFQLLVAHLDGTVRVWDFLDGALLRTVELGHGITHMCVNESLRDQVVVAVNEPAKKKNESEAPAKPQSVLYRVSLSTQTKSYIGKLPPASCLAISHSGAHLVATSASVAYVFTLPAEGKAAVTKCPSADPITCVAFHPEEEWFATGDEIGTIKFWYCTADGPQLPTASHLWHAHPVRALAFTPNGAYLLSAGEEAVVVLWQLHSGRKEFVPRVGGPVRWLAIKPATDGGGGGGGAGEEEWLAGLADRTLVWIGAGSLKVARTVARIKLDRSLALASADLPRALPLAVHPTTALLVLPSSHASFLQIYSHTARTLVAELEVHPSNRVSRPNPDAPALPVSRVERVAISPQGTWLATLDVRRGGEDLDPAVAGDVNGNGSVSRLKVWRWEAARGAWELTTRVERPHGGAEVTALAWMPQPQAQSHSHSAGRAGGELACLLATAGGDGNVRTWRAKVGRGEAGEEEVTWVNRSSFSYRAHVPACCAFAPDGSVLAVGQGPCVTLWDPQTNAMQRVLAAGGGGAAVVVQQAVFVGAQGRWVAVLETRPESVGGGGRKRARRNVLVLWDLLSCTMSWEHDLGPGSVQVLPHPSEPTFTVFLSPAQNKDPTTHDRSTRALLFNTASSRPFRIHKLPFMLHSAASYPTPAPSAAPAAPAASALSPPGAHGSESGLTFVGITRSMDVVLFGDSVRDAEKAAPTAQKLDGAGPAPRTLFQDVFGISALVEPAQQAAAATAERTSALDQVLRRGDDALFDGPAYMLPAMSTLFGPFMESIMQRRAAEEPQPGQEHGGAPPAEAAAPTVTVEKEKAPRELAPRVVDEKEFDLFVELFKQQVSHAPVPVPRAVVPSTPVSNGNGNGNGNGKLKGGKATNGSSPMSTRRTPAPAPTPTTAAAFQDADVAMDVDLPSQAEPAGKVGSRKRGRKSSV